MGIERKNLFGSVVTMPGRPSIVFGIIKGQLPTRKSKEIPDTDIVSTVDKTISSQLVEEGEMSLDIRYIPGSGDPAELIPHADELWRVTLPLASGQSVSAKYEFTGHITSGTRPELSAEGRCTQTITVKLNSKPIYTEGT